MRSRATPRNTRAPGSDVRLSSSRAAMNRRCRFLTSEIAHDRSAEAEMRALAPPEDISSGAHRVHRMRCLLSEQSG